MEGASQPKLYAIRAIATQKRIPVWKFRDSSEEHQAPHVFHSEPFPTTPLLCKAGSSSSPTTPTSHLGLFSDPHSHSYHHHGR